MKKIAAVVLAISLLAASAGSSYSYTYSSYSYVVNSASVNRTATGYLKDVKYSSDGLNELVEIYAVKYADYSIMELTSPQRIVVDIFNAQSTGKQQVIQTNGNAIKRIRYAQFDPYTARVVLEVNGETEYGVEKTVNGVLLYIGGKPGAAGQDEAVAAAGTVKTGGKAVSTPGAVSAGDAAASTPGGIKTTSGAIVTTSSAVTTTSSAVNTTPGAVTTTSGAVTKPVMAPAQTITLSSKFKLQYIPGDTGEDIAIVLGNYAGYKVARLTDPDRLQITIPKPQYTAPAKQANIGGYQVKTLSYARTGNGGAVITLGLNDQSQYSVAEEKGRLVLSIRPPEYRHIRYHNSGDRVYFTIENASLTSGDEFLEELYTGTYDESGINYTITFPTGQADLGNGIMNINDRYLKSVEVRTDPDEGTTTLVFNGAGKYVYFPYTRSNPGVTTITVLKPAAENEKLVVIDPGHGGSMTGAVYKDLYEKDLNLDIAKRLNALLKKKGVKTYMIREDDSDVANYERAYIANKLGAKLYLSIHNNAMDNKNYRGTMTLYCPSDKGGFSGKDFAEIIHGKMLARLKTVDRDVRDRSDLIVLKATEMPAALAEVAFMTNSTDRGNLQNTTFRQNAAQALCDSVIEALKRVK